MYRQSEGNMYNGQKPLSLSGLDLFIDMGEMDCFYQNNRRY